MYLKSSSNSKKAGSFDLWKHYVSFIWKRFSFFAIWSLHEIVVDLVGLPQCVDDALRLGNPRHHRVVSGIIVFMNYKHSSLTARMGKWVNPKFGRNLAAENIFLRTKSHYITVFFMWSWINNQLIQIIIFFVCAWISSENDIISIQYLYRTTP